MYCILEPALIAKSNIILDVKPWDDETDLKLMEASVRKIQLDGLLWGASKLVPLAYGIKKLQISSVVEDDKVSIDWLTEQIEAIEDLVCRQYIYMNLSNFSCFILCVCCRFKVSTLLPSIKYSQLTVIFLIIFEA